MPRVHQQKAAKDYPDHGIKKGDVYYSWSFRYGGEHKSRTYPRPSQLTQSKLSTAYAAMEGLEDSLPSLDTLEGIAEAARECAEEVRGVAEEYRDSRENMPEGLQDGPTGQECEEKADALEACADELESAADDVEALDADDFREEGDEEEEDIPEAMLDEARSLISAVSLDC